MKDDLIREHFAAAAALVEHALGDAVAEDPAGAAGLARAMQSGGMLVLETTLTQTGLARLAIRLVTPAGESLGTLMSCNLEREVRQ